MARLAGLNSWGGRDEEGVRRLMEKRKDIGMSNKFKGRYTVADGYVGRDRPQTFMFHAGDLEDDMTDEDLERAYEEAAQYHFEQFLTPEVDRFDEFKVWAREQLAMREKDA